MTATEFFFLWVQQTRNKAIYLSLAHKLKLQFIFSLGAKRPAETTTERGMAGNGAWNKFYFIQTSPLILKQLKSINMRLVLIRSSTQWNIALKHQ